MFHLGTKMRTWPADYHHWHKYGMVGIGTPHQHSSLLQPDPHTKNLNPGLRKESGNLARECPGWTWSTCWCCWHRLRRWKRLSWWQGDQGQFDKMTAARGRMIRDLKNYKCNIFVEWYLWFLLLYYDQAKVLQLQKISSILLSIIHTRSSLQS